MICDFSSFSIIFLNKIPINLIIFKIPLKLDLPCMLLIDKADQVLNYGIGDYIDIMQMTTFDLNFD